MDPQVGYQVNSDTAPPSEYKGTQVPDLTKDEMRLLRDCNRESFYYRCLPFACIGMGVTYFGVKTGHLSGHAKYGPAIKMTAAAFAGWVLGKVSYKNKCEEKFLTLENSSIGNAIRKRRGFALRGSDSEKDEFLNYDDATIRDRNITSSGDFHSSSGSLNFDKNEASLELDDRERPTMDSGRNESNESQSDKKFATYEELRRKNREDYEKHQANAPRSDTFRPSWSPNSSEPLRRTSTYPQKDTLKNTYGDTWDNPKFS